MILSENTVEANKSMKTNMGRRAKTWADGSRENAIRKAQFAVHDKMAKPRS